MDCGYNPSDCEATSLNFPTPFVWLQAVENQPKNTSWQQGRPQTTGIKWQKSCRDSFWDLIKDALTPTRIYTSIQFGRKRNKHWIQSSYIKTWRLLYVNKCCHGCRLNKKDKCTPLRYGMCILGQVMEQLHCKVGNSRRRAGLWMNLMCPTEWTVSTCSHTHFVVSVFTFHPCSVTQIKLNNPAVKSFSAHIRLRALKNREGSYLKRSVCYGWSIRPHRTRTIVQN